MALGKGVLLASWNFFSLIHQQQNAALCEFGKYSISVIEIHHVSTLTDLVYTLIENRKAYKKKNKLHKQPIRSDQVLIMGRLSN